jgi:histone acetyltransferase (RNA polymerase elongator complex component)
MDSPLIIPIFIPYQGCPRRCIYCNEHITAGSPQPPPTAAALKRQILASRHRTRRHPPRVEIAFYGGTFTGLDREAQAALLAPATACLREGLVQGIRISTRPDEIDDAAAQFLRTAGVWTVEIGAQSLVDAVLEKSRRGYTAADVVRTVTRLKTKGFATGLHLMIGLPGEDGAAFAETVRRAVALRPDMVRLHPTLVFRGTELADLYRAGAYAPLSLEDTLAACRHALRAFESAGIPVIRLGVQTTPEMEAPGVVLAGPYHPALRSRVEESIAGEMAARLLAALPVCRRTVLFTAAPTLAAHLKGRKKAQLETLQKDFDLAGVEVAVDPSSPGDVLTLTVGDRTERTGRWGPL